MSSISEVDLDLISDLKDSEYRRQFFRESAQETIASQIRYLREIRNMRQVDLAKVTGMKQSAVSRLEKADYSSWNFNTLMRIGDALDARVRITIEPSEDVIKEFERTSFDKLTSIGADGQFTQDNPTPEDFNLRNGLDSQQRGSI